MSENSKENIQAIMDVTMEKLRAMVDANTIIGTPIQVDNVTLIPVSRASFGLATGGSDFPTKKEGDLFGGGGGAGVSLTPVAFISVCGETVKMLPVYNNMNSVDKALSMTPDLIEKIKGLFKKHPVPPIDR